jgi:ubiquinone biosynthesis protein Coq4
MDNQTPREILSKFYTDNHLEKDGGQSSSFVKIDITPKFHFYFPNFNARKKAVIKHDIHHLLTNYETTVSGESEISAWEIASGCKNYWTAFFIDTSGVMLGISFNFWGVLKAFSRGRQTKNLYHDQFSTDQALDMQINDLRKHLYLDKYTKDSKPTFIDFILFLTFALFGSIYSILLLPLLPFIILYTIYIELKIRIARR